MLFKLTNCFGKKSTEHKEPYIHTSIVKSAIISHRVMSDNVLGNREAVNIVAAEKRLYI